MSRTEFIIVSLDPGGTTGVAICKLPKTGFNMSEVSGMELGPEPHFKDLWSYLTNIAPDVLLCENFNKQDNEAVLLTSLKYIGVAELYSELTGTPLIMRQREFKDVLWLKGMVLKDLGFYTEGKPHRNDATRHLIHYIVNDLKRKEVLERLRK